MCWVLRLTKSATNPMMRICKKDQIVEGSEFERPGSRIRDCRLKNRNNECKASNKNVREELFFWVASVGSCVTALGEDIRATVVQGILQGYGVQELG